MLNDDMGDSKNITNDTFKRLSERSGKDVKTVKKEMAMWLENELQSAHAENKEFDEVFEQASQAWGQSVHNAKEETLKMLRKEL